MLFSSHDVVTTGGVYRVADPGWLEAIRANATLATLAAILILLAFIVSLSNALS